MRNITFSPILLCVLVQLPIKKKTAFTVPFHTLTRTRLSRRCLI